MEPLHSISIVTPCFNSIHTIRETIESVATQDYPRVEHIVIDGGSRDGTVDLLREYPHLRWVSEKDEGHYHAMNKGVSQATGDFVAILNADDCYRPGMLLEVGRVLAAHPDWDGVFGDVVYVDENSREIFRRQEAVFDYNVLRFSGVCYVIHPTLFVRRSIYHELGMFPHKRFLNCCDFDFILKLGRAGHRIGHIPKYLVNYRYHPHGQSADLRVTRNMAKESLAIMREHGFPDGLSGRALKVVYRLKRQWQKLCYRGTADLIPGKFILRRHMKEKTEFTSNIDVEKL